MNAEIAIYLVQVLNLFAFSTIAVWYVVPRLRNISRVKALVALMCVHLGRTLCLQAYSSQDAGLKMSDVVRDNVVIGDLTGWALAIIILFLLQHRMKLSIALVWLLIIETFLDLGLSTFDVIKDGTISTVNGTTWLIVAFYVPLMEVALGLTIWQLITRRTEQLK